jgi:DNA gyrase subunit A
MVVTVSHNGYIKRTSANSYRAQKRGGKGMAGAAALGEDFVEHLFVSSTLSDLMVFSSLGRLYWLKVYEIPEAGRTARGRALINLLSLREGEDVTAVLPLRKESEGRIVVMATKQGVIKRTALANFRNSRKTGLMACTLKTGDELIGVGLTQGEDDIILATKNGMAIRFSETCVREVGRTAQGVRGISLKNEDLVVGMTIVGQSGENDDDSGELSERNATLLTVCENGFGKRTRLCDYRAQNRGGIGLIDIRTNKRNGPVVGVSAVNDDSQLMLITSSSKIIRTNAAEISVIGRNTQGVRLIDLEDGEKVVAIARLDERDDD